MDPRRPTTRAGGGYIGCASGIAICAIIGRFWLARELADPVLELIRPISPVAIVPLAMLWFGIGEMSKYFIIIYATLIIVLLNTAAGVSRTPVTRVRAARCLGAAEHQVFLKVILPSAVPYILTGMRVALGFSFMGIVAAELIGAREGIGFLIMNSQLLLQTDQLFVGLLTLGVVGLASTGSSAFCWRAACAVTCSFTMRFDAAMIGATDTWERS